MIPPFHISPPPASSSSYSSPIHPLGSDLDILDTGREVRISASATAAGQTGVEMEALAAATFAALNLLSHDCITRGFSSGSPGQFLEVYLDSKTGGKSGDYIHERCAVRGWRFKCKANERQFISLPICCRSDLEESTLSAIADPSLQATLDSRSQTKGKMLASASLHMPAHTWRQLVDNVNKKGDVLGVSRLAGELAATEQVCSGVDVLHAINLSYRAQLT